jgi:hypothetical protein
MLAPQESQEGLVNLEEQLGLDDSQLAIIGIARSMTEAESRVDGAERSVTFTRNYSPTPPGPRPHPEDGGMDHQDWNVARLEYEQYDDEYENDSAEDALREAEDKLYDLREDKELAESGDASVVSKYAQAERERIQAELEKQRRAKESAERHATYMEGVEIDGAPALRTAIENLADNPNLNDVRGKESSSGWRYKGSAIEGAAKMFERHVAVGTEDETHELLTLRTSSESTELQYVRATDVDEQQRKRYGKDIAKAETHQFVIKESGKVAEQRHYAGPINGHMPYFMNNGRVARAEGVHGITPEPRAELSEVDIQKMQSKITEVAEAMKELTE